MATVFLSIGSNVGDKLNNVEEAERFLNADEDVQVVQRSEFYLTKPIGGPPQEDYLNGVLKVRTSVLPSQFLEKLKTVEKSMGRVRRERNCPRIIDIDILLFDEIVLKSEKLTIPHPRMHERYFVLKGLAEIAPNITHPIIGKTAIELLSNVGADRCVRPSLRLTS
ncbi:MAG: 2-amino-4-hydroxy-6-hydroxymethyldihydropteridine diphosphokinase [Candidatus Omnitrophica bacterium]|nr:2-amino-4-hydroxy-6-hydroxymethyldihydropteridine diphosphokinase [Candidatus Omnitrophota bacterium]